MEREKKTGPIIPIDPMEIKRDINTAAELAGVDLKELCDRQPSVRKEVDHVLTVAALIDRNSGATGPKILRTTVRLLNAAKRDGSIGSLRRDLASLNQLIFLDPSLERFREKVVKFL